MKHVVIIAVFFYFYAQDLPNKEDVLGVMTRVNGYFMGKYDYSSPVHNTATNTWTRGVYYEGLMALYQINKSEDLYKNAVNWGTYHKWGLNGGTSTRNADNQVCGQTYIDLYKIEAVNERIGNIRTSINAMVNSTQINDWNWCDAIQMAMPVFARLGSVLNNTNYYEKMFKLYNYSRNQHGSGGLFNTEDGLWYRDSNFQPPYKEPNGKNCYWSRGNGWVFAALARVLDLISINESHRALYVSDFAAMAQALKKVQRSDGFWDVSLFDPTNYGGKETTGTSLFVYGMAGGINNRYLDREEYLPTVLKAWNGLVNDAVHSNGFLGYVQGQGSQPSSSQPVTYDKAPDYEDFATGCFLLGASEVYKL
jgi:rhamnogalacturonyl hydrolase YesR